jgi:3-oxoacyl-[acyl-carrier-protein] synthase II
MAALLPDIGNQINKNVNMKRVVVTGMAVVSPLGCSLNNFWQRLLSGESAVQELSKLDSSMYRGVTLSAEVKDKHQLKLNEGLFAEYGTAVYYAAAATAMCLEDAGLDMPFRTPNNYGLIMGTTNCNQDIVERTVNAFSLKTPDDELPDCASKMLRYFRPAELSGTVARFCGIGGANMVIPTACSAGNYAVGTAYSMIQDGRTPIIIAGGSDPFTRSCYTVFYRLGAMAKKDCRPFDQNRTGMIVGEGAATLVLEDLEHALSRNARIYGEIKGYGLACDAYHPTAPDPEGSGAVLAMHNALKSSNLDKSQITYISAHGTGTKANDAHEAKALHKVFGKQINSTYVNGIKSMLGHCMGAASAMEAVAALLSLYHQKVPPNCNTETIDPAFEISFPITPPSFEENEIEHVLSNSFAFGGNVCSVILGKYDHV